MNYKNDELKKLQSIEIDILRDVIRVCEENDITYFSVGGTTLGAVRHHGFIPWDDDIDIGMMRDDYEKFLEIAPASLSTNNYLQYYRNEKDVIAYYAKVRRKGTKFIEKATINKRMEQGVFIDVMPYDVIPNDEKLRLEYRKKSSFWRQIILAKGTPKTMKVTSLVKRFAGSVIRGALHIILLPIPGKLIFDKFDRHLRQYNGKQTNWISSRGYTMFECHPEDIFPVRKQEFEDIEINVPNNADRVLKIQYGDYMTLPPENKRMTHKPVILEL